MRNILRKMLEKNNEEPRCNKKVVLPTHVSLLELSHEKACQELLKSDAYCTLILPSYITFGLVLAKVNDILTNAELSDLCDFKKVRNYDVNHQIIANKDGRYAWRPLQLIHPVLYVNLVHMITTRKHWRWICRIFKVFHHNPSIECLSIPVVSLSKKSNKAEQIGKWWHAIEQRSIALALDYGYVFSTDITDCYGSIYTHSIAWAIHTKKRAKAKKGKKGKKLLGNMIDKVLQDMNNGQTNGIPQGSMLMDFVAEIILGYADYQLSQAIKRESIEGYHILRYRDDYRIFVNNPTDAGKILKILTELLQNLGFKLNPSKTMQSNNVITGSIKADKLAWLNQRQYDRNLEKHLLIIYSYAQQYPNSGTLQQGLVKYLKRLKRRQETLTQLNPSIIKAMISIVVDIAYHNPRTYPPCTAIIAELIQYCEKLEQIQIYSSIKQKFSKLPNTGHMEIWLQKISWNLLTDYDYQEPLCQIALSPDGAITLWNSDWISFQELKDALIPKNIIDVEELKKTPLTFSLDEIDIFLPSSPY